MLHVKLPQAMQFPNRAFKYHIPPHWLMCGFVVLVHQAIVPCGSGVMSEFFLRLRGFKGFNNM